MALPRLDIHPGKSKTRTALTAAFNLEVLSLSELKKMQKDVAKAISTFEDRQKAEARAKVEALVRDLGYSLAELSGIKTKSSRASAAPKYRQPENPALTWSGRGRTGTVPIPVIILRSGRKHPPLSLGPMAFQWLIAPDAGVLPHPATARARR
jgi:DNA-binding protein H-NS